jgi:hypothetical protein
MPLASEEHFRNPAVIRDLSGQTVHRAADRPGQRRRPAIPETERVDEPPLGRVDDHGRVFAVGEYRGCVGSSPPSTATPGRPPHRHVAERDQALEAMRTLAPV